MEQSQKKKSKRGGWLIWLVAVLLVLVPGFMLGKILLQYKGARDEYRQLAQTYTTVTQQGESQLREIDWEGLKEQNPQVIGWIQMDSIELLDYPIVQGEDNGWYLTHSYTGAYRPAGAIFMECQNDPAFVDLHTIVYGHNVKDGSMFGGLTQYMEKSFWEENGGDFLLYTPAGVWKYEIFSVEQTQSEDPACYTIGFAPGEEYEAFLQAMKDRSVYDTGVEVDGDDYVITLSTCVSGDSQSSERMAVHAKCMQQLQ